MVIWVNIFQTELMVEICSKSLVRAIGKRLIFFLARTPIKTHKGDEKWPLFVNKQLFWWSASITLNNNNAVLTDLHAFFSLNTLPYTSVSLTGCISSFFSVLNILTMLHVWSL